MDFLAATFIVRLELSGPGSWTGVVERVGTGEKRRVGGLEAIGPLIAQMTAVEIPQETINNCQNAADTRLADTDSAYDAKG